MTFDLSDKELEMLESWYQSAAGESDGADTEEEFNLLDKLGFQAHRLDLQLPNPNHFIEEYRPIAMAQRAAVSAYLDRHPERREEALDHMEIEK